MGIMHQGKVWRDGLWKIILIALLLAVVFGSFFTGMGKVRAAVTNLAPSATLSVDTTSGTYTKDKAVDGIKNADASRWVSTNTAEPHWFQLDWASSKSISNIKVWSGKANGVGTGYQIYTFKMQSWNGSTWVDIPGASVTNNTQDGFVGQYNDFTFTAVTTTKIRMYITDGVNVAGNTDARLLEIEVWGDNASATPTPTPTPPPGSPPVQECNTPGTGWIWCDDFEVNRLSSYFEYQSPTKFVLTASAGTSSSQGMKATWTPGNSDAGNLKIAFGRTPSSYINPVAGSTTDYREIYWRFYVKTSSNWVVGSGQKLTRGTVFSNANWAQAMIGHVWSAAPDNNYLSMDPARGTDAAGTLVTTQYNDFANLSWLGKKQGTQAFFVSPNLNKWQSVEVHLKLNTAGQSDGVMEYWIDDVLQASSTNLNFLGSYNAYGINSVMLENYNNTAPTVAIERYYDNFVISTQRIYK